MPLSVEDVPDEPRWVETRAMLLRGACRVLPPIAGASGHLVVDGSRPLTSVVGRPSPEALVDALRGTRLETELLVQEGEADLVASALPGWSGERAILHTLAGAAPASSPPPDCIVRMRSAAQLAARESVPAALRAELRTLGAADPVAVIEVESYPVSFCYAGAVTERYWDISVETLEAYRGRGFAGLCARRLIRYYRSLGRSPVWGAFESNVASLRAAKTVGFVPTSALFAFRRHEV
jgi:GNAT superfamily N-acetyltransferase